MVAKRVGVLVITDSLAWSCLGIEDILSISPTRSRLHNIFDRFVFSAESRMWRSSRLSTKKKPVKKVM